MLATDDDLLTVEEKSIVHSIVGRSQRLKKIFAMRSELGKLWQRSNLSREDLLRNLQKWCKNAEASGIQKLHSFSLRLKASY